MFYTSGFLVLLLITFVYWPVLQGEFVYDDIVDFLENPGWLVTGDGWKHYIFTGFHGWTHYFRPLVVALFTAQVRLFDVQPGPMHAISLSVHLINALLVGALADKAGAFGGRPPRLRRPLAVVAVAVYGLHPAMIEPVAWIASQFDLVATLFMLLGLLSNTLLFGKALRPFAVALCFFLAACSKESAVSFPLILVVFDWLLQSARCASMNAAMGVRGFVKQNWQTYLAVFLAGLVYLWFRQWALAGGAIPPHDTGMSALNRVQVASHSYFTYWRVLFAPTHGMSPLHRYDPATFAAVTPQSIGLVIAAIALLTASICGWFRRGSALASIVLVVTAALIPVIKLLPTGSDPNLYNDRYLTTAIAAACALFPMVLIENLPTSALRVARLTAPLAFVAWLASSILIIRGTLPLWNNSVALWTWALKVDPNNDAAKSWLITSYLREGMVREAEAMMEAEIKSGNTSCAGCMMTIAAAKIQQGDLKAAETAIEAVRKSPSLSDPRRLGIYLELIGQFQLASNEPASAEELFRQSLKINKATPSIHLLLARSLAAQGERDQSLKQIDQMLQVVPEGQREAARKATVALIEGELRSARAANTAGAGDSERRVQVRRQGQK